MILFVILSVLSPFGQSTNWPFMMKFIASIMFLECFLIEIGLIRKLWK